MAMENVARRPAAEASAAEALEGRAVRRAAAHLMWFLIVLYVLNSVDRTNVGFAALTMNEAVGLSSQAFGVAVGIFYLGYLVCEIPSNILLARTGARRSIARMAISSGLVTMLTAFVQGPISFYILRFMLGVAEAGYLVGIVLYLSYWFPARYRARYNALFMLSMPVAFSISGATAGAILGMGGDWGLAGWQWLFLLEGAPAVLVGLVSLWYLSDRPSESRWLSPEEARALEDAVNRDYPVRPRQMSGAAMLMELPRLLGDPVVMTCGMIYLALNFGLLSLTSWTPSVIKGFGLSVSQVSFLTMVVPLVAAVAMIIWGRMSDRREERITNTTLSLLAGAAGWALAGLAHDPVFVFLGFVLAAIGVYATYAISFTIPQTYVEPASRPVAIAAIGVIGNIGGVFVPMIVGYLKTVTGNFSAAFVMVAIVMALAAACTYRLHSIVGR